MTPRRAATITLLVLLAALVWAPLGVSGLGGPAVAVAATASRLPVIDPEASPSAGTGSAAPAPVASPAPATTPLPAPATSPVAEATPAAAPAASAIVVARALPSAAKPAASPVAAGKSATPAMLRSASPAASGHPGSVPSPSHTSDLPAAGELVPPGPAGTAPWLLAALTGLALIGSLLVLLGRRHANGRPALAPAARLTLDPAGSPTVERRRSARGPEGGIERRGSARLQPADDPILSAMGLGADAPAAGGARAVRARTRRIREGLEPQPTDERPS